MCKPAFEDNVVFLVFPEGCTSYNGPHALQCLLSLWNETNCLPEGTSNPATLSRHDRFALNQLNIQCVVNIQMLNSRHFSRELFEVCLLRFVLLAINFCLSSLSFNLSACIYDFYGSYNYYGIKTQTTYS